MSPQIGRRGYCAKYIPTADPGGMGKKGTPVHYIPVYRHEFLPILTGSAVGYLAQFRRLPFGGLIYIG